MLTLDYLCFGRINHLPPFALWPAFPTADYYGGTDAPQVSPADYRLRCRGVSHVHGCGLPGCVGGGYHATQAALCGILSIARVGQVS